MTALDPRSFLYRDSLDPDAAKALTADALANIRSALEDSIADNANFSELVADQKLNAATTPPLTATPRRWS